MNDDDRTMVLTLIMGIFSLIVYYFMNINLTSYDMLILFLLWYNFFGIGKLLRRNKWTVNQKNF